MTNYTSCLSFRFFFLKNPWTIKTYQKIWTNSSALKIRRFHQWSNSILKISFQLTIKHEDGKVKWQCMMNIILSPEYCKQGEPPSLTSSISNKAEVSNMLLLDQLDCPEQREVSSNSSSASSSSAKLCNKVILLAFLKAVWYSTHESQTIDNEYQ